MHARTHEGQMSASSSRTEEPVVPMGGGERTLVPYASWSEYQAEKQDLTTKLFTLGKQALGNYLEGMQRINARLVATQTLNLATVDTEVGPIRVHRAWRGDPLAWGSTPFGIVVRDIHGTIFQVVARCADGRFGVLPLERMRPTSPRYPAGAGALVVGYEAHRVERLLAQAQAHALRPDLTPEVAWTAEAQDRVDAYLRSN